MEKITGTDFISYLTKPSDIQSLMIDLIQRSDSIFISTGQASANNIVYETLFKNRHKISHFYCGIRNYKTQPKVLKDFKDVRSFEVVDGTNLFHHNVYIFKYKDSEGISKSSVITGSMNFTNAGLRDNMEVIQHTVFNIPIDLEERIGHEIGGFCRRYDIADIINYEEKYAFSLEVENRWLNRQVALKSAHFNMTWGEYVIKLKQRDDLDGRLLLLENFRGLTQEKKFHELALSDRLKIAGLYRNEVNTKNYDNRWFGRISRGKNFIEKVKYDAFNISEAIKLIPKEGPVLRGQYEHFKSFMVNASGYHSDPKGIVTRMLTMVRPDYFLCVTSTNLDDLATNFSFNKNRLDLENYWDLIIEPLQKMDWWNTPMPEDKFEKRIWSNRTALLGIFMKHSKKK